MPDGGVVVRRPTGVCVRTRTRRKRHGPASLPHTPGHELAGTGRVGEASFPQRVLRPEGSVRPHGDGAHDGQDRLAEPETGLRLPLLGDLRRARLVVRLRPLRRPPQGERQGALARGDGAGARRHRRARLRDHPPPEDLGDVRARRRLHRSARRLQDVQAPVPGRSPRRPGARGAALRAQAEQAPRRDDGVRPHRATAVQPHVRDARRSGRGDGPDGLPPTRDGAGDLRQLQERRPAGATEAPVRDRPGRQVVPQRDHARELHLPHARVRADGDGVLRPPGRGRRVVPLLDRRAARVVHALRDPARAAFASAPTTPRSCRTTRARTSDIEYLYPIGWSELEGIANRGTFDLTPTRRRPERGSNGSTARAATATSRPSSSRPPA